MIYTILLPFSRYKSQKFFVSTQYDIQQETPGPFSWALEKMFCQKFIALSRHMIACKITEEAPQDQPAEPESAREKGYLSQALILSAT